jgi:hypothetical protein
MLPRPRHCVCQLQRLGLGGHFDGLATGRLSGPARDVYLDNLTAFGNRCLGSLVAQRFQGCQLLEVGDQAFGSDLVHGSVRAEVAIHASEKRVVAVQRRRLQAPVGRALRNPPFESLTQGVRLSLLPRCPRAGFGLPQDVVQ